MYWLLACFLNAFTVCSLKCRLSVCDILYDPFVWLQLVSFDHLIFIRVLDVLSDSLNSED